MKPIQALLTALCVSASLHQSHSAESPKPNIILIYADDWGWGDLSCHGHPWLKTPNIIVIITDDHGWADLGAQARSGSREFQASSAIWTFCFAVSSVKGGSGGRGFMVFVV